MQSFPGELNFTIWICQWFEGFFFFSSWFDSGREVGSETAVSNKLMVTIDFFNCKSRGSSEKFLKRMLCLLWFFCKFGLPPFSLFTFIFEMLFCMRIRKVFFLSCNLILDGRYHNTP